VVRGDAERETGLAGPRTAVHEDALRGGEPVAHVAVRLGERLDGSGVDGQVRSERRPTFDAATSQHAHDEVGTGVRRPLVRGELADGHGVHAGEMFRCTVVPQLMLVDHATTGRIETAVGCGERPAQGECGRIDTVVGEQATQDAARPLCLGDRVTDRGCADGVGVAPGGLLRVVADAAALDLDDDDAALGVDQQEVDLGLVGPALLPHRYRDLRQHEDAVIELVDRPTPQRLLGARRRVRPAWLGRCYADVPR
jgi:hypothetical protein